MTARVLRLGSVIAILGAAAAVAVAERRTNRALRDDLARVQRQSAEAARLQKQNLALAAAVARLAASPSPKGAATPTPTAARLPRGPAPVALAPGFTSRGDCRNVGTATARNAFETYIWAVHHGETAALAELLSLSPTAQETVNTLYASLPAAAREKYGSAEQMFATVYAYANPISFAGMQITEENPGPSDTDVLTTHWQFPRGQIREHTVAFTLTPAGWKRPVSDREVDEMLQPIVAPR